MNVLKRLTRIAVFTWGLSKRLNKTSDVSPRQQTNYKQTPKYISTPGYNNAPRHNLPGKPPSPPKSKYKSSSPAAVKKVDMDRETVLWISEEIRSLGPAFVKIGQFLSSRRDIISGNLASELERLQDDVQPLDTQQSIKLIKCGLGRDINLLEYFESEPVASASIGQVHLARTKRGDMLALKIQRPNVRECFELDIKVLLSLLHVLRVFNTENVDETVELLTDFREWLVHETDYSRELENYKLLSEHIEYPFVLPVFQEEMCTPVFLVMSYLPSTKFRDIKARMSTNERKALALQLMDSFVHQLVTVGIVHGDPHEGNMGVTEDGRIALYDMGNVIHIEESTRIMLKHLLVDIMLSNFDNAVETMKRIPLFDVRDEAKVYTLLEQYGQYIRTLDINVLKASFSQDNMRGDLPVKFDGLIFRIVRVFGLLEGICKQLDDQFSYEPIFSKYILMIMGGGDSGYMLYRARSDVRRLADMCIGYLGD